MFDDFRQDRPLSERARKGFVVGAVVLLILVGGATLIRDLFTEDQEQETAEQAPSPEPTTPPDQESDPTDTTNADRVEEWFPHSSEEFAEAGQTAEDFLAAAATVDYESDDFEGHAESLAEWADDTHAETLTTPDGIAQGIWRVLGQDGDSQAWTGQASVEQVRSYDAESVEFLVDLEAVARGGEGQEQDLGSYQVVTVKGGGWQVEFSDHSTN